MLEDFKNCDYYVRARWNLLLYSLSIERILKKDKFAKAFKRAEL
jgi:hypothetical protein